MAELLRLMPQRQFYSELTQSAQNARREVIMDFYILEKDQTTAPLFTAIEQAARRGVSFKIHMDHLIALNIPDTLSAYSAFRGFRKLAHEGLPVEVRKSLHQKGDSILNPLRRNHRKVAIIDAGEENGHAYLGGSNIAGRFINWRDSMVQVDGTIAQTLREDFRKTWEKQNVGFHEYRVNDETEALSDSKKSDGIQKRTIAEIKKAKHTVWLETTYMDSGRIQQALITAKRENPTLDVRVLLPHPAITNDPRFHFFPGHWLNPLVDSGIEVYLYGRKQRQFTHAKTLLTDTATIVGSSNFADELLAGGDAELILLSRNHNFREQAKEWFEDGIAQSERYQRKKLRRKN